MGAAAERVRRDARVVGLFLAGLSYRDIAAVVGFALSYERGQYRAAGVWVPSFSCPSRVAHR
jgi:hypothetical protein